jgi:hypothetical protein
MSHGLLSTPFLDLDRQLLSAACAQLLEKRRQGVTHRFERVRDRRGGAALRHATEQNFRLNRQAASTTIKTLSRHLTAYVTSNDRALLMRHWINGSDV